MITHDKVVTHIPRERVTIKKTTSSVYGNLSKSYEQLILRVKIGKLTIFLAKFDFSTISENEKILTIFLRQFSSTLGRMGSIFGFVMV